MKTLSEVIHATAARAAQAVITPTRGSPKLEDCLRVYAIPGTDTNIQLTAILVGQHGLGRGLRPLPGRPGRSQDLALVRRRAAAPDDRLEGRTEAPSQSAAYSQRQASRPICRMIIGNRPAQ